MRRSLRNHADNGGQHLSGCAAITHGWWRLRLRSSAGVGHLCGEHFAITTDINRLISPDLGGANARRPTRMRFPDRFRRSWWWSMRRRRSLPPRQRAAGGQARHSTPTPFIAVRPLDGDPFFAKNGLLFQSDRRFDAHHAGAGPGGPDHRRSGRRSVAARADAGAVVRRCSACRPAAPSSTTARGRSPWRRTRWIRCWPGSRRAFPGACC